MALAGLSTDSDLANSNKVRRVVSVSDRYRYRCALQSTPVHKQHTVDACGHFRFRDRQRNREKTKKKACSLFLFFLQHIQSLESVPSLKPQLSRSYYRRDVRRTRAVPREGNTRSRQLHCKNIRMFIFIYI